MGGDNSTMERKKGTLTSVTVAATFGAVSHTHFAPRRARNEFVGQLQKSPPL